MVAAGAAVEDEGDRLLDHAGAVGDEPRTFDVEPDLRAANARFQLLALSLGSSSALLERWQTVVIKRVADIASSVWRERRLNSRSFGIRVHTRRAAEIPPTWE